VGLRARAAPPAASPAAAATAAVSSPSSRASCQTPRHIRRYATAATAEAAIQTFNMRHALPDLTGREARPLAVRPANVRAAAAAYSSAPQRAGMARGLRPAALQDLGHGGLQGLYAQPQQGGMYGGLDATSPLGGWRPAARPTRAPRCACRRLGRPPLLPPGARR
jgi:hypothetical protein